MIDQFLETPFDLGGKKASQLLSKKARRRRRRRRSPSPASDSEDHLNDDPPKRKKEKKNKEKEQYKSAQFIEDSDEEYGDIEAFLEKEKTMREKAARVAAEAGGGRIGTMKPTGTKKRRRKSERGAGNKKRRGDSAPVLIDKATGHDEPAGEVSSQSENSASDSDGSASGAIEISKDSALRTRPKPRPIGKRLTGSPSPLKSPSSPRANGEDDSVSLAPSRRRPQLVISDDED